MMSSHLFGPAWGLAVTYWWYVVWVDFLAALWLWVYRGHFKLACYHFLGGAVSMVFKLGVGDISGWTGGSSGRKTGTYLWGSARSKHSIGRIGVVHRCPAGCALDTSAAVGRCSSGWYGISSWNTSLPKISHSGIL